MPYDPTTTPYGVTNGFLVLPADCQHMSSMDSVLVQGGEVRNRAIQELDDEEWAYRVDSAMIVPSKANAIYRYAGAGGTLNGVALGEKQKLELRPKDISGKLTYYRTPVKPVFAYTLNGRVITQDVANSVDLEWSEVPTMNILVRTLQLAGVKQSDTALYQAMTADKNAEE